MNLESLQKEWAEGKRHEFVLFWKPDEDPYGVFCQWYSAPFRNDAGTDPFRNDSGTEFETAEHYMMAGKASLFHDLEALERIFETKDPQKVKKIGRSVKGFDKDAWGSHGYRIVKTGNLYKFSDLRNAKLKDILLNTGDKVLVEASPYDDIWGIKLSADDPDALNPLKWKGTNLLGFALMNVRETLRK